jgi:hypothetical protein
MKKKIFLVAFIATVFTLINASELEGSAAIGEIFFEKGPYLATNYFPKNTLVDVVNLENNISATFIVYAPLENSSLLAVLSREAADAIGLSIVGRIRMKEKDGQFSYSSLGERRIFSGDTDYTSDLEGYYLALVPAESRPPEDFMEPDIGSFIPSIPNVVIPPLVFTDVPVIPTIPEQLPPPPITASPTTPRFSAPLIQNFTRGSYYVQIGAYEKTQTVESEILKVDKNLPVAVMETVLKTGSTEKLVYRVLIGPLNFGDSGIVFQRYKAIYKDAFLWIGK